MTISTFLSLIRRAMVKTAPACRFLIRTAGSLIAACCQYRHTVVTLLLGLVAYNIAHGLPGILRHLSFAVAIATLILVVRAVWIDLGTIASEARIAEKTLDAIQKSRDHIPGA